MLPAFDNPECAVAPAPTSEAEARAVCLRCPELEECRTWALSNPEASANMPMVGGMNREERKPVSTLGWYRHPMRPCLHCGEMVDPGEHNIRRLHEECRTPWIVRNQREFRGKDHLECYECGAKIPRKRRVCDECKRKNTNRRAARARAKRKEKEREANGDAVL